MTEIIEVTLERRSKEPRIQKVLKQLGFRKLHQTNIYRNTDHMRKNLKVVQSFISIRLRCIIN